MRGNRSCRPASCRLTGSSLNHSHVAGRKRSDSIGDRLLTFRLPRCGTVVVGYQLHNVFRREKPMNALRSLSEVLDAAAKADQTLPAVKKTEEPLLSGKQPIITEQDDSVLARGATSVAEIEKLMGELGTA